jgi:hypothetical protein
MSDPAAPGAPGALSEAEPDPVGAPTGGQFPER